MRVIVNGWFLCEEQMTGVGRHAVELLTAMDKIVAKGEVTVLAPLYAKHPVSFKNIDFEYTGSLKPFMWQQITLPAFLSRHKEAICLSLTPTYPFFLSRGYVIVHDISPIVNKSFYSLKFRMKANLQTKLIFRKKRLNVITISQFSADEIKRVFSREVEKKAIIGCGWEHMMRIEADESFFERYPQISLQKYMFAMSSHSPNKNFAWVYNAAKNNPTIMFVIAGKVDTAIFGETEVSNIPNVVHVGYVTDSEAKALLMNAKAFLFPSFYEGFGIPPLEALTCGTPIVVSDIPCLREVFGGAAYYIDPHSADVDLQELLAGPTTDFHDVLDKHTWHHSAECMCELLGLKSEL